MSLSTTPLQAPEGATWGAIPGVFVVPEDDATVVLIAPNHACAESDPSMWVLLREHGPIGVDDEEVALVGLPTALEACAEPGFRDGVIFAHRRALAELEREGLRSEARHLRSQLARVSVPHAVREL